MWLQMVLKEHAIDHDSRREWKREWQTKRERERVSEREREYLVTTATLKKVSNLSLTYDNNNSTNAYGSERERRAEPQCFICVMIAIFFNHNLNFMLTDSVKLTQIYSYSEPCQ